MEKTLPGIVNAVGEAASSTGFLDAGYPGERFRPDNNTSVVSVPIRQRVDGCVIFLLSSFRPFGAHVSEDCCRVIKKRRPENSLVFLDEPTPDHAYDRNLIFAMIGTKQFSFIEWWPRE